MLLVDSLPCPENSLLLRIISQINPIHIPSHFPKIDSETCKLLSVKLRSATKLCRNFEGKKKGRKRKLVTTGPETQGASRHNSHRQSSTFA